MAKLLIPMRVILETRVMMVVIILNTRRWLNCWSQRVSSFKRFISRQKAKFWNKNDCRRSKTKPIDVNMIFEHDIWYVNLDQKERKNKYIKKML